MSLEWWEYYESEQKLRNLRNSIDELKKELEELRAEVKELKKQKEQQK